MNDGENETEVKERTKLEAAKAALEAWLKEHIHNTNVSQDTAKMNRVNALVDSVKREIETLA